LLQQTAESYPLVEWLIAAEVIGSRSRSQEQKVCLYILFVGGLPSIEMQSYYYYYCYCYCYYSREHLSYDGCLEVRGQIIRTVLCCWSCAQS